MAATVEVPPKPSLAQRMRASWMTVKASDPGKIRLYASLKGVFACMSAGVLTALLQRAGGISDVNTILLSIFVCMVMQIAILAPQPALRRRTLLLTLVGMALVILVVALLQPRYWVITLALAPLVFLSFYLRRYGLIWTSVGMVALFTYYFCIVFNITFDDALWAFVGCLAAVVATLLWQNVLWPYEPRADLVRATSSYAAMAAEVIDAIRLQLSGDPGNGGAGEGDQRESDAEAARAVATKYAALAAPGRVLIQQSAALTPPNTPAALITARLRTALYATSQGIERMTAAAAEIAPKRDELPAALRSSLLDVLEKLAQTTRSLGSAESVECMANATNALMAAASAEVTDAEATGAEAANGEETSSLGELRPPFLHLLVGGKQVSEAIRSIAATISAEGDSPAPGQQSSASPRVAAQGGAAAQSTAIPQPRPVPIWGGYMVHPVVLLGLQAVIAYLLGLLASWLLGVAHPNWVFWTAFIVIAGSTGESLRKIVNRIVGAVLGALVGTFLVILLPTSLWLSLAIIFFCIFMTIYMRVISYAVMVFWITVLVAGLHGIGGDPSWEVLFRRPLDFLIGGVIAALVVLYVLPFRATDRFKAALGEYLRAADAQLAMLAGGDLAGAQSAAMQRSSAFDNLKQTFPSVSYEYNPLTQARSPLLAQDVILSELEENVRRMEDELSSGTWRISEDDLELGHKQLMANLRSARDVLHRNIASVLQALAGAAHPAFVPMRATRREENARLADQLGDPSLDDEERGILRALNYLVVANQALADLLKAQG